MHRSIAVLGAGNGGQTLSAHLAMMGNKVSLYEHPSFVDKLIPIQKAGGIQLTGAIEGFGKLRLTSSDMGKVLEGAEIVYIVVPSFGQIPIMKEVLPFLADGMKVVFIPGNFGSLEAFKLLKDEGVTSDVTLAETDTLPYACRMVEPGKVQVWGLKEGLSIAALPGKKTETLVQEIRDVFPIPLWTMENVLPIAFSNLNMIVHCAAVLLNIGRIESTQGDFRFYCDGVTPTVGKLQELMDSERVAIGKAYGMNLERATEWVKKTYPVQGNSMHELLSKNPIYAGHGADAPKQVRHRYITEDVPNLLVPVVSFARAAGVETPIIDSVITLLSSLTDEDYLETGRNFSCLGLQGLGAQEVLNFVNCGERR